MSMDATRRLRYKMKKTRSPQNTGRAVRALGPMAVPLFSENDGHTFL